MPAHQPRGLTRPAAPRTHPLASRADEPPSGSAARRAHRFAPAGPRATAPARATTATGRDAFAPKWDELPISHQKDNRDMLHARPAPHPDHFPDHPHAHHPLSGYRRPTPRVQALAPQARSRRRQPVPPVGGANHAPVGHAWTHVRAPITGAGRHPAASRHPAAGERVGAPQGLGGGHGRVAAGRELAAGAGAGAGRELAAGCGRVATSAGARVRQPLAMAQAGRLLASSPRAQAGGRGLAGTYPGAWACGPASMRAPKPAPMRAPMRAPKPAPMRAPRLTPVRAPRSAGGSNTRARACPPARPNPHQPFTALPSVLLPARRPATRGAEGAGVPGWSRASVSLNRWPRPPVTYIFRR